MFFKKKCLYLPYTLTRNHYMQEITQALLKINQKADFLFYELI